MKVGMCGTMESNDCLVTVKKNDLGKNEINITSIVDDFYHDEILACVKEVLKEFNLNDVTVDLNDKGALDFTIKARVKTAIERMNQNA